MTNAPPPLPRQRHQRPCGRDHHSGAFPGTRLQCVPLRHGTQHPRHRPADAQDLRCGEAAGPHHARLRGTGPVHRHRVTAKAVLRPTRSPRWGSGRCEGRSPRASSGCTRSRSDPTPAVPCAPRSHAYAPSELLRTKPTYAPSKLRWTKNISSSPLPFTCC